MDETSSEDTILGDQPNVVQDVDNFVNNIDAEVFMLDKSFSTKFYTEDALNIWPMFVNRGLIDERIIDMEAFTSQNLVKFLKDRCLFSTVTQVAPYCRTVVYEFYGNLISSVGDARSAKHGKVFVRNKIYDFSPSIINTFFGTPEVDENEAILDVHMVTSVLTGGLLSVFPDHPHKLAAAKLSSFYSVLHKIAIRNWTPSSNSTVVTSKQLYVLFDIGTGRSFNFGKMVFDIILQFANGACKGSKLPFPSLIYGLLVSQGFISNINEDCVGADGTLKIATGYFKGNRRIDLPWIDDQTTAAMPNPPGSDPLQSTSDFMEHIRLPKSFVQSQIAFGLNQITHAKTQMKFYSDQVAYFENQIAEYRLLLDTGIFSEQKGGVDVNGKNDGEDENRMGGSGEQE